MSARHVSFIETGRSSPSRAMVLRLAEVLAVPLREQNQLLLAAGLAPMYGERPLDDPDMAAVRDGVERVLSAYNPFPVWWWTGVGRSCTPTPGGVLSQGVAPHLLQQPTRFRIALHPEGLAPRIRNLAQWRHHLVERLRREVAVSGSEELCALLTEISRIRVDSTGPATWAVSPFRRAHTPQGQLLSFLSTVTTFGTALDLTAAELRIEAFLPPTKRPPPRCGETTWRIVNTNRVWRHGQPTGCCRRHSRRCRCGRLLSPPAALGGTTAKVTINGESTGDAHAVVCSQTGWMWNIKTPGEARASPRLGHR